MYHLVFRNYTKGHDPKSNIILKILDTPNFLALKKQIIKVLKNKNVCMILLR